MYRVKEVRVLVAGRLLSVVAASDWQGVSEFLLISDKISRVGRDGKTVFRDLSSTLFFEHASFRGNAQLKRSSGILWREAGILRHPVECLPWANTTIAKFMQDKNSYLHVHLNQPLLVAVFLWCAYIFPLSWLFFVTVKSRQHSERKDLST